MRRRRLTAALLALPALAGSGSMDALAAPAPLRVGLVPYLSTRTMVDVYQPLRAHLEQALGRPAVLYTAADFASLADNLRQGAYDIALLPAHFAWLAVNEWGSPLLARAPFQTEVQLVVAAGSPLLDGDRKPADLAARLWGQQIAALDPLSQTSMALQRWLASAGAPPGEVQVRHLRSVASAILAVRRGDAIALAVTDSQLRERPDEAAGLVPLVVLRTIPAPVFVARAGLHADEVEAARRALLSFAPATAGADGATVSRARYVAASVRDLDGAREFALQAHTLLDARAAAR